MTGYICALQPGGNQGTFGELSPIHHLHQCKAVFARLLFPALTNIQSFYVRALYPSLCLSDVFIPRESRAAATGASCCSRSCGCAGRASLSAFIYFILHKKRHCLSQHPFASFLGNPLLADACCASSGRTLFFLFLKSYFQLSSSHMAGSLMAKVFPSAPLRQVFISRLHI